MDNSAENEKAALVNFLGTIYGQANALDKAIVSPNAFLKPSSESIKPLLAEVLRQQPQERPAYTELPSVDQVAPMPQMFVPQPEEVRTIPPGNPLKTIIHNSKDVDRVVQSINELNDTLLKVVKLVTKILPKKPNVRAKAQNTEPGRVLEIPQCDLPDQ